MSKAKGKTSVKKNFIYNVAYQLFTMLVPLITTPYISKVLLPEGVGRYSYTYSIVSYFILFAQLGFGYYAQREIAKHQNDKYQQSVLFFEIIAVKSISVGIACIAYIFMCCTGVFGEYTNLMWWWLILIIAQEFDIAFLFQGNEEFSKIVFRNFFIKLLGIVLIFVVVRTSEDVWIYVISIAASNLLGILSTWVYLPQYICKIHFSDMHPMRHIIPALRLFIPTIASVIYTYLDKTLIGIIIQDTYTEIQNVVVDGVSKAVEVTKNYSDLENGFYEQSEKIVKVGMSVITALGAVMLPRNTKEYSSGNAEKLKDNIYLAARFMLLIGFPIMFGLMAIAPNMVPWFLGDGYEKCIIYLRLFCPLVILIGLDNVLGIQYLLTTSRDKQYSIAIVSGAVINILLNILLIPFFWGYGAIVASIMAEFFIVLIMYLFVKKEISFKKIIISGMKYFISGSVMFAILYFLQEKLEPNMLNTIFMIGLGGIIYLVGIILLRDSLVISTLKIYYQKMKDKIKK